MAPTTSLYISTKNGDGEVLQKNLELQRRVQELEHENQRLRQQKMAGSGPVQQARGDGDVAFGTAGSTNSNASDVAFGFAGSKASNMSLGSTGSAAEPRFGVTLSNTSRLSTGSTGSANKRFQKRDDAVPFGQVHSNRSTGSSILDDMFAQDAANGIDTEKRSSMDFMNMMG